MATAKMSTVPALAECTSAASDFSTAPVLITVGETKQHFYVHEPVLRAASRFFEAALDKEWLERQTRVVNLPESNPEAFTVYVNWLYFGRLFVDDEPSVPPESKQMFEILVRAYVLGDQLLDVAFKDAAVDAFGQETLKLYEGIRYLPGAIPRHLLYENSLPTAPLRRLVVRRLTMFQNASNIKEDEPSAFLHDVIQALVHRDTPTVDDFVQELADCKYHEHEAGAENCYRSKRR
ncbi:unnamed protein product [Cercospora beticola]|nr:unnamed protein product [Cercospora beticola]